MGYEAAVSHIGPTSAVQLEEHSALAGLTHVQSTSALPPDCVFSSPADRTEIEADPAFRASQAALAACQEERMAGGVAVGDYDDDSDPDLAFSRSAGGVILYRNDQGSFSDVTAEVGLTSLDGYANGVVFADLSNDGFPDLVVSTIGVGRDYLLENNGGRFKEVGEQRGVSGGDAKARGGTSVAVGDYDRDGYVDLFIGEWRYGPRTAPGMGHARLLRNRGRSAPGHFTDVTKSAGIEPFPRQLVQPSLLSATGDPGWSFSPAFVDLDNDGWQDLALAADYRTTQVWWNRADGTFSTQLDPPPFYDVGNAMGSTFADIDRDGDLDWFTSAIYDPQGGCQDPQDCASEPAGFTGNRLWRNDGDRKFADITQQAGVMDAGWAWGSAFADFDNDGAIDLAVTNGQDFGEVDDPWAGKFRSTPKRLWMGLGDGRFSDAATTSGFATLKNGKGLATADFDGDGLLDVVIANNGSTPDFYRNTSRDIGGGWIELDVRGTRSNRGGLGAVVEIVLVPGSRPQRIEVGAGSHFLGNSDRLVHVGLGAASSVAEIVVRFPVSGAVIRRTSVNSGQRLVIEEPKS